ncbi:phosphatidate cytidylyltransferase [candidate division KSB1 bacterium]
MNTLTENPSSLAIAVIFVILTVLGIITIVARKQSRAGSYVFYIWLFFLIFLISDTMPFRLATWLWGFLSFFILREFFSMIDFRVQDRFGIVAAYISIPFMMHFIHTDWYNMFIITIPVYSFLVIPFLVALGGKETEGAITSIGIIVFGLFLFVYCIGHIAYLSYYNLWMAVMLILNIAICDISVFVAGSRMKPSVKGRFITYFCQIPFTVSLTFILAPWCGISHVHSISLGLLIPALIMIGNYTIQYIEADLGIFREDLRPGKGLIIENIKSILYAAPVVFHYFRYFMGEQIS